MLKQIKFQEDVRAHLAEGIDTLCRLLEDTYGPDGLKVLMERPDGSLLVTKSSAAIVQDFTVKELFPNAGVQMVREALMHMSEIAGDGTTLTGILLHSMIREGKKYLTAGYSPVLLRKGLIQTCAIVVRELSQMARPVKDKKELQKIVETASGSRHIAELVLEAVDHVQEEGIILVKESKYDAESRLELVQGMQWNKGYVSPDFDRNKEREIIFRDALLLITEEKITSFEKLLPILEVIMEKQVPLLIIAEEVSGEALAMLLHNVNKKIFRAAVVQIDGIGQRKQDNMEDLAVFAGGKVIRQITGNTIEKANIQDLGSVKEVRIGPSQTIFLAGNSDPAAVEERCSMIQQKMQDVTMTEYDREKHRERMGRLRERIVILHAGAVSKAERLEEKRRIESAVRVARNALFFGVTAGGGAALIHCIPKIHEVLVAENEEEVKGMKMLAHALCRPLKILCRNAGIESSSPLEQVRSAESGIGYDVKREKLVNMEEYGILDPIHVLRMAVEQSVSMAGEWITTAAGMVSTAPDREDIELARQGVPIMR